MFNRSSLFSIVLGRVVNTSSCSDFSEMEMDFFLNSVSMIIYRRNSFAIKSRGELWNRCIFYFHAKKPISSSSSLRAASCIADNWERGGREGPRSKPRNLMIAFPTPACPPRRTDKTDHYTFMGNCPPTPPLSQHQHSLSQKRINHARDQ